MWHWIKSILFGWLGFGKTSITTSNDMKPDSNENQIRRLESKVNFLTGIAIAQTALLTILLVMSLMPSTSTIVFFVLIGIAFVALFHKYIPAWTGWSMRAIGSLFKNNESTESKKEPLA